MIRLAPGAVACWLVLLLAVVACSGPDPAGPSSAGAAEPETDRWEAAISAFEEHDRANPPPAGGVVFLGSSSFRRWDLEASFPGQGLVNRGFGGSQMADALRYLDRVVLPLKPRTILVYEGDNDLAAGKPPAMVEEEFRALVARVRAALPTAKVVFVSVKPSPKRWHLVEAGRDLNGRIRGFAETDDLVEYVEAGEPLLGADGQPRADLFVEDELHLSEAGYAIWAEVIAPHLD